MAEPDRAPPLRSIWLGTIPYGVAWSLQRRIAQARRDGNLDADCVLLLEHPPVYTMGRNGDPAHIPGGVADLRALGAEYEEVDRGGSVTFHGPGQLVAYPLIQLAGAFPQPGAPGRGDVIRYLRALETAILGTVAGYGVFAGRRAPYTGVWVENAKLAAIGVKLAGGVTTHGIALNVSTDLSWFGRVVPCGIRDGTVTSMERCGAGGLAVREVAGRFAQALAGAIGRTATPAGAALEQLVAAEPAIARAVV